jgi:flagellar motor switch protein FliG
MLETSVASGPPRPAPTPAGVDKAAILLLTLGSEAASTVFRHLTEAEVRQVSAAIARVRSIPHEIAVSVHEEARRRLAGHDGVLVDGERFARQLVGTAPAGPTGETDERETLASRLEAVSAAALADLVAGEHPQTIAVVVANLPARKAGDVLALIPEAVQADVVHRIADLQPVPAGVLADLAEVLGGQIEMLRAREPRAGGAHIAAQILNAAPMPVGERVFAHLAALAPELGETIRGLMFGFEDLVRLDNRGLQIVLQEVPRGELMVALKTASARVREKVLASVSPRVAEMLKDDLTTMGPVGPGDVEQAQASVVAVVRRLEAERRITLGGADFERS